jgi:signal peptidase I
MGWFGHGAILGQPSGTSTDLDPLRIDQIARKRPLDGAASLSTLHAVKTPAAHPTPLLRRLLGALLPFVIAIGVALTLQATVGRLYEVHQSSMEQTLQPGDILFGEKISPRFGSLAYGDIVVFTIDRGPAPGASLIKRVIGLPGDELRIADGVLYRNGEPLFEPYTYSESGRTEPLTTDDHWTILSGELFVMGDHRDSSTDSRVFGPVAIAEVEARILFRAVPLSGVGAP